jgi:hypothetical protein
VLGASLGYKVKSCQKEKERESEKKKGNREKISGIQWFLTFSRH